jgi:hypothetical protein
MTDLKKDDWADQLRHELARFPDVAIAAIDLVMIFSHLSLCNIVL